MKKKIFNLNQRGVITYFLVWLLFAISLLFIFTFIIPFTLEYNTRMYASAEKMFIDANTAAQGIQDSTVKAKALSSIQDGRDTITDQIENESMYFQYSWILVAAMVTLILFLFTRQNVERGVA